MIVTIYYNPACGTSRNALAMVRERGEAPEVIEYLTTPPSRARLVELIARGFYSSRLRGIIGAWNSRPVCV